MCGIVAYKGNKNCYPILLNGLHKLEYRGYDSAGVACLAEDGKIVVTKRSGKVIQLEEEPNPIDFSHFVVDVNPSDLKDRIYLDNVVLNNSKDKNSCNFTVALSSKKFEVEKGKKYDNLMKIDNQ